MLMGTPGGRIHMRRSTKNHSAPPMATVRWSVSVRRMRSSRVALWNSIVWRQSTGQVQGELYSALSAVYATSRFYKIAGTAILALPPKGGHTTQHAAPPSRRQRC